LTNQRGARISARRYADIDEEIIMDKQTQTTPFTAADASFDQEVLQSDIPVLVDFWAAWCGPCKALDPTISALADDYQGQLRVAKLNVDENPETAARYGVRSIPTLILFKDGEALQTSIGVQPKSQLAGLIEPHLH
jgi:thioredoxin 1